jgi:predicted  nucleic acid-binding Zn-ribbon protein
MTTDDLDYKIYDVCKSIAKANIEKERVYWNSEELFNRINKKGLEDAKALLRIFEKEITDHNSKLKSASAKIENLSYRNTKIRNVTAFRNLNISKIKQAILDNPDKYTWEIAREFIN